MGEDLLSGLIIAVLVVVWAVVLVPMWLRRHDTVTESRSVDRFSTAMRVLSRRPPYGGGTRAVVMPGRPPGAQAPQVSTPQAPRRPATGATARRTPGDARALLRDRRKRVLLILLAVTGLTFLLSLAGLIGWGLLALPVLLLAGYVLHLRMQVVRSAATAGRRSRPAVPPGRLPVVEDKAPPSVGDDLPGDSAQGRASTGVTVESPNAPAAKAQWEPIPVPLPSYVTAPVAPPRVVREPLLPPPLYQPFEPDDAEIEVLFQRRWAVND